MYDQVAMGEGDRITDLQKELKPGANGQTASVAVLVEVLAIDVLHDEIGCAFFVYATVEQAGDIRVLQRRQDLALRAEAGFEMAAAEHGVDGFDRDFVFELAIDAARQKYRAHTASAEQANGLVWAEAAIDSRGLGPRRFTGLRLGFVGVE